MKKENIFFSLRESLFIFKNENIKESIFSIIYSVDAQIGEMCLCACIELDWL